MSTDTSVIKKERNSSFELLRIIAMFMIVIFHYVLYNGFNLESADFGIQKYVYQLLYTGSIGVDIFVLITGYFGYTSKGNPKKIVNIILQVLFYSVVIGGVLLLTGKTEFSPGKVLKMFMPVTFKQYWFVTAYVLLMLVSPFINMFLHAVSREVHFKLIVTMIAVWSIIPFFTGVDLYANDALMVFFVYIIGAYFGRFPDNMLAKKKNAAVLAAVCGALLALATLAAGLLSEKIEFLNNISPHFYTMFSPLALGVAVGLFVLFSKLEIRSRFINKAASCTFSAYLIHENPLLYPLLWKTFLKGSYYVYTGYWAVHLAVCPVAVYIVCLVIEMLRKLTVEKPMNYIAGRVYDGISGSLVKKYNALKDRKKAQ